MLTHHIIFDAPGIYIPKLCPNAILWQRHKSDAPPPIEGSYVNSAAQARRFGDVTVVKDGIVVTQLMQEEVELHGN